MERSTANLESPTCGAGSEGTPAEPVRLPIPDHAGARSSRPGAGSSAQDAAGVSPERPGITGILSGPGGASVTQGAGGAQPPCGLSSILNVQHITNRPNDAGSSGVMVSPFVRKPTMVRGVKTMNVSVAGIRRSPGPGWWSIMPVDARSFAKPQAGHA